MPLYNLPRDTRSQDLARNISDAFRLYMQTQAMKTQKQQQQQQAGRQQLMDMYSMAGTDPSVLQSPEYEQLRQKLGYPQTEMPRGGLFGMPEGDANKYDITHTFGPMGARKSTTMKVKPPVDLDTATTLRKEFDASKIMKNYQTVERSERGMRAAYEMSIKPDTKSKVASDQALAVLFQKMLDPDSVVRESEYARTPEGIGVVSRIESYIPQLQKGGLAISDEDRQALYSMAETLLQGAKTSMNQHIERYQQLGALYKVDPKYILGNIQPFDTKTGVSAETTSGNRIRVIGPNGETGTMSVSEFEHLKTQGWRRQ